MVADLDFLLAEGHATGDGEASNLVGLVVPIVFGLEDCLVLRATTAKLGSAKKPRLTERSRGETNLVRRRFWRTSTLLSILGGRLAGRVF